MEAEINLSGIKVKARIGVGEEERARPQGLEIDASFKTNIREAVIYDDIKEAVDYVEVTEIIQAVAGAREYKLVETLAYEICRKVLTIPEISSVQLKVIKRPALLDGKVESVSVKIGPMDSAEL